MSRPRRLATAGRQDFSFPPLPPSRRLTYAPLAHHNAGEVWRLFQDDPHPFITAAYKQETLFLNYVGYHLTEVRTSCRRSGHDWLLREAGTCVGLINLYDLCRTAPDYPPPPATVGFTIGAPYRRRGFAAEAVAHLLHYTFGHFAPAAVRAFTEPGNVPSQQLLARVGFRPLPDVPGVIYRYFEADRADVAPAGTRRDAAAG